MDDHALTGREAIARAAAGGVFMRCLRDHPRQPLDVGQLRRELTALAADLPSGPMLSCLVHVATFLPLLRRLAHPALTGVVQQAIRGGTVGAIAATDAVGAGSDLATMATSVDITDDKLVLAGAKQWVTNGMYAEHLAVLARHRPGNDFAAFTLILVPAKSPGVHREPTDTPLLPGAGLCTVHFDHVSLPSEMLLGRPGRGLAYFVEHIAAERLAGGIWTVALGRRVLRETLIRLGQRTVGGEPLWHRSAVRQPLARLAVELRMLDALIAQVITASSDADHLSPPDTMMIKAALDPLVTRLANHCLHLHGADGLTGGSELLRLTTDLKAFGIAGGSTETMLELIAERLPKLIGAP